MSRKTGIIGSGIVARTLGEGFLRHGYQVMLGTRDTSKLTGWQAGEGKGAQAGSFAEAARFGDIIVLAVRGKAAQDALEMAGSEHLAGKTILDATNPIADSPPENGVLRFFTGPDDSLMERLQRAFPEAHFVKAFNSVGSALMVNPKFESAPTMFICGNDEGARAAAGEILAGFGWETADMGGAEAARAIEPLCILWCIPGLLKNEWTHAFKMLKH